MEHSFSSNSSSDHELPVHAASAHSAQKAQQKEAKHHHHHHHRHHHGDHLHLDDSTSTAVPSATHSPSGGPQEHPLQGHLNMESLGPALASLEHDDEAEFTPKQAKELQLQRRLEWYFSAENLCGDFWLRSRMDRFGWVPLTELVALPGLEEVPVSEALAALQHSTLVQISGDFRRVRAGNPAVWAAFAPRPEEATNLSSSPASRPSLEPEVDVADEDLTIAAHLEADDAPKRHRRTRRGRRHGAQKKSAQTAQEFAPWALETDGFDDYGFGAWIRESDDSYAMPAASMMGW